MPLLWVMIADVADYSESKNNRRATAIIFSAMILGLKFGLAVGGSLVAKLLDVGAGALAGNPATIAVGGGDLAVEGDGDFAHEERPAGPREGWRRAITAYYDTFRAHRALTLAWAEARSTHAEIRELWAQVFEGWVRRCAEAIEAERQRGAAPAGPPARDLAVALTSMNERVLYATFTGDGPAIAESGAVDVLLEVWLRAVYGTVPVA